MSDPVRAGRFLDRRDLLKSAAAGLASTLGTRPEVEAAPTPQHRDLIRAENEKPGTTDWLLKNTRVDPKTKYRCPWIEGYCSHTSIRPGEELAVMVSTNPASPFVLDLYRLGYYGGKGGRHLQRLGPFKGVVQPDPPIGEQRLRECRWEPSVKLTIAKDWPSGVYLGKLTAEKEELQSYVIFIVRDDRTCDFLFQCSDTTWSAYNRWPSLWSLYDSDDKHGGYWGPDVRVSFDRPYAKYYQVVNAPLTQGSGEFLLWEFPLAFWMEKEGRDVSYISNVDTHTDAKGLLRCKGWLSVGHDEYWSPDMYNHVKAARDAGVNLAFLSADSCIGLLSFSASSSKAANRLLRRVGNFGPRMDEWARHGAPEVLKLKQGPDQGMLIGARDVWPYTGGADWICAREKHWLFAGTGMKNGDAIPGLVGWEWHGDPASIRGLEVVAQGEVRQGDKHAGTYTATIYPGPKDNFVFNAATIWWSDGLSAPPGYLHPSAYGAKPKGPDPRVQRITANLLNRFRGS